MHTNLETENKVMLSVPLSGLFGVIFAYAFDILFRGGVKAFLSPKGYGLTFFGWLIGCIVFLFVYGKICRLKGMFLLNCHLPTYAIAQAFGRIGCFLGGCCFGKPSTFLGVVYPEGSYPYSFYGDTPLFPIQLLESAYLFILFFILFFAVKFAYRSALYLIFVSIGRFIFEFFRADDRGSTYLQMLSPSQLLSCILALIGFLLLYITVRSEKRV